MHQVIYKESVHMIKDDCNIQDLSYSTHQPILTEDLYTRQTAVTFVSHQLNDNN
jgi:hypothetical protein